MSLSDDEAVAKTELLEVIERAIKGYWEDSAPIKFREIPYLARKLVETLTMPENRFFFGEGNTVLHVVGTDFVDSDEDCYTFNVYARKDN